MTVLSTNDLDEARFWHGGLSVFTKNWMQTINAKDHENRHFTILLFIWGKLNLTLKPTYLKCRLYSGELKNSDDWAA